MRMMTMAIGELLLLLLLLLQVQLLQLLLIVMLLLREIRVEHPLALRLCLRLPAVSR